MMLNVAGKLDTALLAALQLLGCQTRSKYCFSTSKQETNRSWGYVVTGEQLSIAVPGISTLAYARQWRCHEPPEKNTADHYARHTVCSKISGHGYSDGIGELQLSILTAEMCTNPCTRLSCILERLQLASLIMSITQNLQIQSQLIHRLSTFFNHEAWAMTLQRDDGGSNH